MPDSPTSTETLVLLLTQHQEPLFRYIFSLVPREADARDILQETSLALYRKFTEYDPARPFLPWAYRFAYFQVQKHREKSARSPLLFSEDIMDLLASERTHIEPRLDERLRLLDACLQKLTAQDQELVTAIAADRVRGPHARHQAARGDLPHLVAEVAVRDLATGEAGGELVVRPLGHLFGQNVTRVAFKRGAYLRNFVYKFAELLSDRLDRNLVAKAMTGHVNDYEL